MPTTFTQWLTLKDMVQGKWLQATKVCELVSLTIPTYTRFLCEFRKQNINKRLELSYISALQQQNCWNIVL